MHRMFKASKTCMASIKKTWILIFLVASCLRLSAQSFSFGDLFGQAGKLQKNYLAQIAAYRMFESELKQGYNVIRHGLGGIRDINAAELNAHSSYYQSLVQVNSAVKNDPRLAGMLQWQRDINGSFNQPVKGLTGDEQTYWANVKAAVLKGCNDDLTNLQHLMQEGDLQMTDDERLQGLAKIHASMLEKYEFTRRFIAAARLLVAQRQHEINDTQTLVKLYENH
ncbi:hypothetical protein SAMN05192574_102319 [Mucilaginibacter gossypiicola]|uniref:Uncharacterized protein n=2 Tax=Mucilaginibacter gossypiicola TaxID=551995 RepID=A0A1H8DF03_9SPHI|nr:hypothetical protein SAMN05192574_102319 [Mucilaginibacter gossypiicola]